MELPTCAVLRRRGTVIVRMMDLCEFCHQKGVRAWAEGRVSYCELCSRTTSYNQISECDSARLRRSLPCRGVRSRKVNVYAAACLLLLVGGLSPQTAAAPPHRTSGAAKKMANEDSKHWENPCDYGPDSHPEVRQYNATMANSVALEARKVLENTARYHDQFAKETHTYDSLEKLLEQWETYNWFRDLSWYHEEMLPEHKTFNQVARDEFIDGLMSAEKLDRLLPQLYKGLKIIVASFHAMSKVYKEDGFPSLKGELRQTMRGIQYVLCQFQTVMIARKLLDKVEDFSQSDIPDFSYYGRDVLLVFRDSLNYVQYLAQVFQKMYERDSQINPPN